MEQKTILVTGAGGFVGARIMTCHPQASAIPSELLRRADKAQILSFARKVQPSVILHTAAISDIGTCERHPDASYRANVLLTEALAIAAKETGAKLVAFSSDQVYTGCTEEGPYREAEDLPEPANVYARHKLEAEKRTLDLLPDAVMLRATWMYDMPMYGHANRGNFLRNVLMAARTGGQIPCVREQRRGITYVRQVAEFLDQATALPGGAYNFGSENELTMPQTAAELLNALGIVHRKAELIAVLDESRHNLWMDCGKIQSHGICFDTTAEGFRRCVADYALRG